jgi:hypothetical protein
VTPDVNGNVADAASQATAGVQKWSFNGSTWQMLYVLQNGLNIGVPYSVANYPRPATGGCRNLTGKNNGDGTVDLYAVTSTLSTSGDQGADPNKLVTVKDQLKATTPPNGLGVFTTLRTAQSGEVLRGVTMLALSGNLVYPQIPSHPPPCPFCPELPAGNLACQDKLGCHG